MNDDFDLVVLTCSKSKIWDKCIDCDKLISAKIAYTGELFKKSLKLSENYDKIVILSAKYGFLSLNEKIEDYNIKLTSKFNDTFYTKILNQSKEILNKTPENILFLGSKDYEQYIIKLFGENKVINPLKGLSIGYKLQKLKEMTDNQYYENLSDINQY